MILRKRKFIFNTLLLIFEDREFIEALNSGSYSQIIAVTRNKMPVTITPKIKDTPVIDLLPDKEDIFRKFSDTTRNEIRKTYRTEWLDIKREDRNRREAYDLYKKFEYKGGRVPFAESDMKDCFIFSAYYKKEMVSAMYVDRGGNELRVRYIFSKRLETEDKELYKIISNSSRRLVWEICEWGKENGFKSLDLATINWKAERSVGLSEFKMYFNGTIFPEYTYIYKSKTFAFFERLVFIKNWIKKILKV